MCRVYSAATGMSSLNMKLADVRRWPDIGMVLASLLLARRPAHFLFTVCIRSVHWSRVGAMLGQSVVEGVPALGQVGPVFHI